MRYIDAADPFAQHRIESALTAAPTPLLTRACRLHGRIQREDVGLERDDADDLRGK
jgi:hypothetical protein